MAISSQEWSKLHPIRWKRHQRKCWLKLRKVCCKYCGSYIKYTGQKRQFCSFECRRSHYAEKIKARRDAIQFIFIVAKERIGCADCGFHKYGGALDYHHLDSSLKEGRISAAVWYSQTPYYNREVQKCVLVCKNCHYIRHSKEAENGTI